eukprot:TRINITY_DN42731_c0_g1_i1.p1 TRINITY_DN42731_c0_g1~~TRINITY_DN42731_c0_g1_i1.p1  ORF type:complete len:182 (+),score=0.22 TRINITY_DN42731_c0_g1_i1:59-547(+)
MLHHRRMWQEAAQCQLTLGCQASNYYFCFNAQQIFIGSENQQKINALLHKVCYHKLYEIIVIINQLGYLLNNNNRLKKKQNLACYFQGSNIGFIQKNIVVQKKRFFYLQGTFLRAQVYENFVNVYIYIFLVNQSIYVCFLNMKIIIFEEFNKQTTSFIQYLR